MNVYKRINPRKLHHELIDAGIIPILVENDLKCGENIAENTWITFTEDTDMDLVQQVIDNHDPTPLPSKPTEMDILCDYILDIDLRLILMGLGL